MLVGQKASGPAGTMRPQAVRPPAAAPACACRVSAASAPQRCIQRGRWHRRDLQRAKATPQEVPPEQQAQLKEAIAQAIKDPQARCWSGKPFCISAIVVKLQEIILLGGAGGPEYGGHAASDAAARSAGTGQPDDGHDAEPGHATPHAGSSGRCKLSRSFCESSTGTLAATCCYLHSAHWAPHLAVFLHQNDPDLQPMFEDIKKNGMGAMMKYW